jgi:hypothetical protein
MEPRFTELDPATVGDKLFRLVLISRQFGHVRLAGTAEDYIHPQSPEMEFVRDTFTLTTAEIIEKWFGGDAYAVQLTGAMRSTPVD